MKKIAEIWNEFLTDDMFTPTGRVIFAGFWIAFGVVLFLKIYSYLADY